MASRLLDLHGKKIEEVLPLVDEFLMKAETAGLDKVSIMTGKGTGAVKKAVEQYLREARYPWHYEKSKSGQDNEGILIVPMK